MDNNQTNLIQYSSTFMVRQALENLLEASRCDPSITDYDRALIRKGFETYTQNATAFLTGAEHDSSKYLFLPTGFSKTGERSFRVVILTAASTLGIYDLEHMVRADEFYPKKKPIPHMSMAQRVRETTDRWRSLYNILKNAHSSISSEDNMGFIVDPDALGRIGQAARAQWIAQYMPSFVPSASLKSSARSEEARTIVEVPDALHPEKILRDFEMEILGRALNDFKASLKKDVLDVIAGLPGQQNVNLYSYLQPLFGRKSKRRGDRSAGEGDEQRAAKRRDFVTTYPLALSSLRGILTQNVTNAIDAAPDAHNAIRRLWPSVPSSVFQTVAGLNERDTGAKVAAIFFPKIASYLSFVPENFYPENPQEWKAFARFVNIDERLYMAGFRNRGQTVTDFVTELGIRPDSTWIDLARQYDGADGKWLSNTTDKVLKMADRISLSCNVPLAMHMVADLGLEVEAADIIGACRILPENPVKNDARRLRPCGELYRAFNMQEIFKLAGYFDEALGRWDKLRRRLAITDAFNDHAGNQEWLKLPAPPFDYVGEQEILNIECIGNAGAARKFLTSLGDEAGAQELYDVAYEPIHLLAVRKPLDGTPLTMVVLRETQPEGERILVVEEDKKNLMASRRSPMSNSVQEGIEARIEWINRQRLDPRPYQEARAKLRDKAERLAGVRGRIGHDPHDHDQNRQVVEVLGTILPPEYRVPGQWGVIANRRLYQRTAAMLSALDPAASDKLREKGLIPFPT